MTTPLESRWAKLNRADDHLQRLKTEISEFLSTNPYLVGEEIDANQRDASGRPMTTHTFRAFIIRERPDWGPLIGDVLNNLRSSLDHLAWHLSGGRGDNQTAFPIFSSREKYELSAAAHLRHIPEPARARIERQQPWYQRSDDPESHPLWVLHRLTNDDKHKRLHITQTVFNIVLDPRTEKGSGQTARLAVDTRFKIKPFEHGAVIARLAVAAVDENGMTPKVEMNPDPTYEIAFDPEGPARGTPVVGALRTIWGAVLGVLTLFDSEEIPI